MKDFLSMIFMVRGEEERRVARGKQARETGEEVPVGDDGQEGGAFLTLSQSSSRPL